MAPQLLILCGVAVAAFTSAVPSSAAFEGLGGDVAARPGLTLWHRLETVFEFLQSAGWIGYACHTAAFSAWISLSLPTTVIEIATGFLYGPLFGFLCSMFCKTMGQAVAFVVVIMLRKRCGWQVPEALRPRLQAIRAKPLLAMASVRLAPLPLGIKNYGLALCEVDFKPYVLAGLLVNVPFSVLWALTGSSCASLGEALSYTSTGGGSSGQLRFKAAVAVAALALVAAAIRRLRSKLESPVAAKVPTSGDAASVAAK